MQGVDLVDDASVGLRVILVLAVDAVVAGRGEVAEAGDCLGLQREIEAVWLVTARGLDARIGVPALGGPDRPAAHARLAPEIYPGWICRFYLDESVPEAIRAELAALPHVEIVMLPGRAGYEASLWRFRAAADEHAIVAARDADSRLSRREQ